MFKFLAALALFVSFQAYSQSPCGLPQSNQQIDLFNSDDLFFAAKFLGRNGKPLEAIECLNLAKKIAPDYLDVRLELLNMFIRIGDKRSAQLEAKEYELFPTNGYYISTFVNYVNKIRKISPVKEPIPGYSHVKLPSTYVREDFRIFSHERIDNLEIFKQAIKLKLTFKPKEARRLFDTKILPANPNSATVYFYSSLLYYELGYTAMGEKHMQIALEISVDDQDVILMLARSLNDLRWYKYSLKLLGAKIHRFDNYGCFQLASALKQIYDATNTNSARNLDKVMMNSLYYSTTDSQLCREIENQFFKPTLF